MWKRSHTIMTRAVTKEQLWKLFADVNQWHTWDRGIEFARLEGAFEKGNHFILRPKGGPDVKVTLLEMTPGKHFLDVTKFPLAKMYDDHLWEETSEGLKITNTITVTGILGFFWRRVVAQKIVNNLPSDMLEQVNAASRL